MDDVRTIALNTFRESMRSKLMYSVLFFAALLVAVSALLGSVTIGDQVKVIKDFGLFAISFFSVAYAVISGATLLNKELSRKTIYNILAKPVPRWKFLFGKYCGMLLTVSLMVALMAGALLAFTFFFDRRIDWLLLQACFFVVLQLAVICACTIFFSSIVVTPLLSGAFSFAIFLAGRSTDYLLRFVEQSEPGSIARLAHSAAYPGLPHLNMLDVSYAAVYGLPSSAAAMMWGALYSCAYAGVLLVLANLIFARREFN